jgi:hypothetical protein
MLQVESQVSIPSWQLLLYPSFPWKVYPVVYVGNGRMVQDIQTQKAAFSHVRMNDCKRTGKVGQ